MTILDASPAQIFGDDKDEAHRIYRRLAKQYHPDLTGSDDQMRRLNALWARYQNGSTFTITTRKHTYTVEEAVRSDEIANVYPVSWEHDGTTVYGYLRLVRKPGNGDLLANEAKALKILNAAEPERFRAYAPTLVDTFRHRDATTRTDRQTVVTARIEGLRSLAEVHDAYPGGIDGRDAAWMWRRMLAGLGWAHRAGLVHGAVLPETVFIQPEQHGVVFTDWSYSVAPGAPLSAIVGARKDWYPGRVIAKKAALPSVDIAMTARCMAYLMGDRAPTQLRAFARGCLVLQEADSWKIQEEFDDLIGRLYGPRKFRPFTVPD